MALSNITVSIEIDGTTNDGATISETTGGTIQCKGVVEGRRTVTDTPAPIWDAGAGDLVYGSILIINEGDNDGEVQVVDTNTGDNYSLAIPSGATVVVPWMFSQTLVARQVSIASYTSTTTTFKYFVFT